MTPSDALATRIRAILETDRVWSAYALADLEPEEAERCIWACNDGAVALLYRGLEPQVLFLHGDPAGCARLTASLPAGLVQFTLQAAHQAALGPRLELRHGVRMWRMGLEPAAFRSKVDVPVTRLGPADLPVMLQLFGEHPDQPDAFHPRQLEAGVFFGVVEGKHLVSVAGTHIVAPRAGIAAVGNVFTHPDWRGRGLAACATSAVVAELLASGANNLVLNVAQENTPAVRCYEWLGFHRHCAYLEGTGILKETARQG